MPSHTTRGLPSTAALRSFRAAASWLAAFVLSAAMCAALLPAAALASIAPPPLSVPSATIVTMQGVPLWSRNATAHRRVASQIKMLTALVVRDHTRLDDVVVVPKASAQVSSGGVGLVPGQKLTVRQLLNIMLIPSANDAAVALAYHVGGTMPKFVAMMNSKAKAIGLKDTHAADSNGLGKKETSTANDLTVLAAKVMADPVLRSIVGKKTVVVPRPKGTSSTYRSSDLLLGVYKGIEGTKTGFTNPAGYCFTATAMRGGIELVGVVLGAGSNPARFSQMRKLLDWGFAHCHVRPVVSAGTTLGVVPVASGVTTSVAVCATQSVSAAIYDSAPTSTVKFSLTTTPTAPIAAGQRLGTASVFVSGALVAKVGVVARASVAATVAPASVPVGPAKPAATNVLWRAPWPATQLFAMKPELIWG